MSTISVLNENKKVVILSLPHKTVCCKEGHCFCSREGVPSSVHLIPGLNKDLDPAVIRSPQFDSRTMKVHEVKAKKKTGRKPSANTSTANEPDGQSAGKGKGKGKGKGTGRRK